MSNSLGSSGIKDRSSLNDPQDAAEEDQDDMDESGFNPGAGDLEGNAADESDVQPFLFEGGVEN